MQNKNHMNISSKINVSVLIFCLLNTSVFSMQEYLSSESCWEQQEIDFPTKPTLGFIWNDPDFLQPARIDSPFLEEPELPQLVNTEPTQSIEFIDFGAEPLLDKIGNNFICKWGTCEESFDDFSEFVNHVKTHIHGNRLECKWQGCPYTCIQNRNLRIHIRKHTGEKPFVCPFDGCNYASTCKNNLKTHMKKHTG